MNRHGVARDGAIAVLHARSVQPRHLFHAVQLGVGGNQPQGLAILYAFHPHVPSQTKHSLIAVVISAHGTAMHLSVRDLERLVGCGHAKLLQIDEAPRGHRDALHRSRIADALRGTVRRASKVEMDFAHRLHDSVRLIVLKVVSADRVHAVRARCAVEGDRHIVQGGFAILMLNGLGRVQREDRVVLDRLRDRKTVGL